MPEINSSKTLAFKSAADFGVWLSRNHDSQDELWVKIYKKKSGIPSITWGEVVIESLCWGWIDGVKKSLNDEAYVQRVTPRKEKSNWSRINTQHVDRLIEEERMQAPGLEQVRAAKADGRWENAYAPASEMKVPKDFLEAVAANPKVLAFFETLNKTNRYAIAYGLENAKKPATRERRFSKFFEMLVREEKPDFGFKKK